MKLQEIREKTVDELKEVVLNLKKDLFKFRMGHNKIKQLENTAQIKNTKRDIAKVKTVIREKELKELKNA